MPQNDKTKSPIIFERRHTTTDKLKYTRLGIIIPLSPISASWPDGHLVGLALTIELANLPAIQPPADHGASWPRLDDCPDGQWPASHGYLANRAIQSCMPESLRQPTNQCIVL